MYDLIIIGAGPAGMTAAIYAAREKLKFLLIGQILGGQMVWSPEVSNYPGAHIMSGPELTNRFKENMDFYKVKLKQDEVLDVKKNTHKKTVLVKTRKGTYESKAVIIASGKRAKTLDVPGEKELKNKGLSYCATCDAPLYKGKTTAVIGAGNSAMEAALFLAKYSPRVWIININKQLAGDKYLSERVISNKKIRVINNAKTTEVLGKDFVEGLRYESEGKKYRLKCKGIFVEIGLVPGCGFAPSVQKNKWGEIMIFRSTNTHDENMTNIPGIFAAGDVTDIPVKQIVVSAGEGAKAALASFNYLHKLKI